MTTVNRTAIIVLPGRRFLDWLHQADPTSAGLSLEDLRQEATVYLIRECEDEAEVRTHLKRQCGEIFEEQLNGWFRVPSLWPRQRNLEAFDEWFEWSFHSVVVDLGNGPLRCEEM